MGFLVLIRQRTMCMEEYVFVRRMGIFEMPFTRERTLDNKLRRDSSNQVRVM